MAKSSQKTLAPKIPTPAQLAARQKFAAMAAERRKNADAQNRAIVRAKTSGEFAQRGLPVTPQKRKRSASKSAKRSTARRSGSQGKESAAASLPVDVARKAKDSLFF